MFARQVHRFIRKIRRGCWPWYVFKDQDTAIRRLQGEIDAAEARTCLIQHETDRNKDVFRMLNGELTLAEQENTRLREEQKKLRAILQPIYQEERKAVKELERKWRAYGSLATKRKWKKANAKFLSRFGDYAP